MYIFPFSNPRIHMYMCEREMSYFCVLNTVNYCITQLLFAYNCTIIHEKNTEIPTTER